MIKSSLSPFLVSNPFFDRSGIIAPLLEPGNAGSNEAIANRNELLARAFPATTTATGKSKSKALQSENNIDMQSASNASKTIGTKIYTFWPAEREGRWLHSDIKKVAYPYLFGIFDNIVGEGGFK